MLGLREPSVLPGLLFCDIEATLTLAVHSREHSVSGWPRSPALCACPLVTPCCVGVWCISKLAV